MSVINTNLQASPGARPLNQPQELLGRSLNRLSAGPKLVGASGDSTHPAVAKKLDAASLRVSAASTSLQNAISYVQTADSHLSTMEKVFSRLGELARLNQNATSTVADRSLYQDEFKALQDQLRITVGGSAAEIGGTSGVGSPLGTFNGKALFGAAGGEGVVIDAPGSAGERITVPNTNLRSGDLLHFIQQDAAGNYIVSVTDSDVPRLVSGATEDLSVRRSALAATESRLNFAASALAVENENISAAISGIPDADGAQESTKLARYNIAAHRGSAMLAQANHAPQSVLKLLQDFGG